MYKLIKPFLFLLPPEKAHHFIFGFIKFLFKIPGKAAAFRFFYSFEDKRLERRLFGLTFKNPVGIAAGLDKDARLFDELSGFGFGFVEIGTVTPLPQPGNPRPRLFRLTKDQALINRMGFNNEGAAAAAERLKKKHTDVIIGGNIGKNKITPNEQAVDDYKKCFETLYPYVDYFVVNVSSPNTPGLRELQGKEPLTKLLNTLQEMNRKKSPARPVLLKIAPDLTGQQLDDIIEIMKSTGLDGVIATNTTTGRDKLTTDKASVDQIGNGGLSGKPLKERSTKVIRYLSEKSGKAFPIIGVGGIHSADDALEKIRAGADLVQVYTGFIYEGPGLAKRINKAILEELKKTDQKKITINQFPDT